MYTRVITGCYHLVHRPNVWQSWFNDISHWDYLPLYSDNTVPAIVTKCHIVHWTVLYFLQAIMVEAFRCVSILKLKIGKSKLSLNSAHNGPWGCGCCAKATVCRHVFSELLTGEISTVWKSYLDTYFITFSLWFKIC